MYQEPKIVIVKKKKVVGGGHHGGSWKVAYADFVTAMMAFFLVMWIMGMDQGVKDLVQGYFSNPVGFRRAYSGGLNPISSGNSIQNLDIQRTIMLTRQAQSERFQEAAQNLEGQMREAGVMIGLDAEVEIVVTEQGLRIDIMETGGPDAFFERSSAALRPALTTLLSTISEQLVDLPNQVVVEGHTDSMPFRASRAGYTNWELSVDRANAARRELLAAGLPAERIAEVRGYADRELKIPDDPLAPRNRRISLLLPFTAEESGVMFGDVQRAMSRPTASELIGTGAAATSEAATSSSNMSLPGAGTPGLGGGR